MKAPLCFKQTLWDSGGTVDFNFKVINDHVQKTFNSSKERISFVPHLATSDYFPSAVLGLNNRGCLGSLLLSHFLLGSTSSNVMMIAT